jgi:hypothetical protein
MDEDSWIRAHVHLFEFLGGVPKRRPGQSKNRGCEYCTFFMPARVTRSKDKTVVEGAVGKLANNLLGKVGRVDNKLVRASEKTLKMHHLDSFPIDKYFLLARPLLGWSKVNSFRSFIVLDKRTERVGPDPSLCS